MDEGDSTQNGYWTQDLGWLKVLHQEDTDPVIIIGTDHQQNAVTSQSAARNTGKVGNDAKEGDVSSVGEEEQEKLSSQIVMLTEMVAEMKSGFSLAMQELSRIQYGDQALQEKVENNKKEYELQLADVVQMVLTLKTEFGSLSSQLQLANDSQKTLKQQVEYLQYERDILLEELEKQGVISEQLRLKYHSGRHRPSGLNWCSEANLSVLLERAHSAFQNSSPVTSDKDSGFTTYRPGELSSCGEVTPPVVSSRVQSYINNLHNENLEDPGEEINYDSDSSLTAAANKSLDLSRSLGDKCAEMTAVDWSEDEEDIEAEETAPEARSPTHDSVPPSCPSSAKKTPPHEINTKDMLRTRVAREILDTERKYCTCLWTILDHFAARLKQSNILNIKDVSVMFPGCLYRIYEHHCRFLQKLESRLCNWRWQGVLADILFRFFDPESCDLLLQYQMYVKEFPAALHQIKKSCKTSVRFRKFLRKSQRHPCCENLDLSAFLLTPIQRIPRYVLLLKQLLKQTDVSHPDYFHIDSCLHKLATFLTQLNTSIEISMKAVTANNNSPKPRRKLRIGSFRSSNNDSHHIPNITSGRVFPATFAWDPSSAEPAVPPGGDFVYYGMNSSISVPQAQWQLSPTDKACDPVQYESKTLPLKKGRKKKMMRQPDFSENMSPSMATPGPLAPGSGYPSTSAMLGASVKSLPDSDYFLVPGPVVPSTADDAHSSMPRITTDDFGIFGEDDDSFLDNSLYQPSLTSDEVISRRMHRLEVMGRSQSQVDVVQRKGDQSPTQQCINTSLAKNLAEDKFTDHPNMSWIMTSEEEGHSRSSSQRPRSVIGVSPTQSGMEAGLFPKPPRPRSAVVGSLIAERPDRKEHVWEESAGDVSILNQSTVSAISKKELKKRWKLREKLNGESEGQEKRKGFKDSLKSIFFKKRHSSKVLEISRCENLKEQAPPGEDSLIISTVQISPSSLQETLVDENGDPCSAV